MRQASQDFYKRKSEKERKRKARPKKPKCKHENRKAVGQGLTECLECGSKILQVGR